MRLNSHAVQRCVRSHDRRAGSGLPFARQNISARIIATSAIGSRNAKNSIIPDCTCHYQDGDNVQA
jgi:hypothetical protein